MLRLPPSAPRCEGSQRRASRPTEHAPRAPARATVCAPATERARHVEAWAPPRDGAHVTGWRARSARATACALAGRRRTGAPPQQSRAPLTLAAWLLRRPPRGVRATSSVGAMLRRGRHLETAPTSRDGAHPPARATVCALAGRRRPGAPPRQSRGTADTRSQRRCGPEHSTAPRTPPEHPRRAPSTPVPRDAHPRHPHPRPRPQPRVPR
jgi:hypothetical protein